MPAEKAQDPVSSYRYCAFGDEGDACIPIHRFCVTPQGALRKYSIPVPGISLYSALKIPTSLKIGAKRTRERDHLIKKIMVNGPATIVFWADGTKTVATDRDSKDPKALDAELGFCIAFFKKHTGLPKRQLRKAIDHIWSTMGSGHISTYRKELQISHDIRSYFINYFMANCKLSHRAKHEVRQVAIGAGPKEMQGKKK